MEDKVEIIEAINEAIKTYNENRLPEDKHTKIPELKITQSAWDAIEDYESEDFRMLCDCFDNIIIVDGDVEKLIKYSGGKII